MDSEARALIDDLRYRVKRLEQIVAELVKLAPKDK